MQSTCPSTKPRKIFLFLSQGVQINADNTTKISTAKNKTHIKNLYIQGAVHVSTIYNAPTCT